VVGNWSNKCSKIITNSRSRPKAIKFDHPNPPTLNPIPWGHFNWTQKSRDCCDFNINSTFLPSTLSILSTFYASLLCQYSCAKKSQSQTVTREKLPKRISNKKFEPKMLIELTPLSLCQFHQRSKSSFYTLRSPKHKRYWWLNWIVMLLGSACIKAVFRTLMKLNPSLLLLSKKLSTLCEAYPSFYLVKRDARTHVRTD